jgi:DNA-binding XRE family transcriptional regulator
VRAALWPDAAKVIRGMIEDGTLKPGDIVPSPKALAAAAGRSPYVYRRALAQLARDGELEPPVSRTGRCRVPGGEGGPSRAERDLSVALAEARRATGLTQAQFAKRAGLSTTTVHHAETGRLRNQTPQVWARLDVTAGAQGRLIRMHAEWQASGAGQVRDRGQATA